MGDKIDREKQGVLAGKVAFVTGAGSGIGRAAAKLFAAEGACVAVVDVNVETGEATAAAIREAGGEALAVYADLTKEADVQAAVQKTHEAFGPIACAFNVAGGSGRRFGDGPVHECTEAGWDWVMDVNLKSMFFCCKYQIQGMLEHGGGSIVNLSSALALVGGDEDFGTHAYAASKGGAVSFTRGLASYYAPNRIRANVLCPSLIATGMSQRAQTSEHIKQRLKTLQPLTEDFGQPEDVAHAALYLLSDQAKFVTGAVLTVDGGWTVR